MWQRDICERCLTVHPANHAGERPCPKPPSESLPPTDNPYASITLSSDCMPTRGYKRSANAPGIVGVNPGMGVTSAHLGLTTDQQRRLGILKNDPGE